MIAENGRIILALSNDGANIRGIQLSEGPTRSFGDYSETWFPRSFEDFNGKIALEND
jgi:hypothetical protein